MLGHLISNPDHDQILIQILNQILIQILIQILNQILIASFDVVTGVPSSQEQSPCSMLCALKAGRRPTLCCTW